MDKNFIAEMTEKLTAERQELLDSLMATNDAFRHLIGENNATGDAADEAADVVDRKMLEALGSKDSARLQSIDSALVRLRQGKYGLCAKCGQAIPVERLRALPYALLCIECKSADERRNR
jgi:RNA polymerase-binding protein DksA